MIDAEQGEIDAQTLEQPTPSRQKPLGVAMAEADANWINHVCSASIDDSAPVVQDDAVTAMKSE